jgi:predicted RNase H-like HicB family nuclease
MTTTRQETMSVHDYRYTVLFEPAEEGGYTVTCPALPGLVTEGDMLEEARAMAADAIRCYLGSLKKDGLPQLEEVRPIVTEQVTVTIDTA